MSPAVTVVGIGADGWSGLPEAARERVLAASVLLGGERHLGLVPPVEGQVRRPWPRPLSGLPSLLAEHADDRVVALASGDPFVSGIGSTLADLLDGAVEVLPAVSSVALARARMRWPAESSDVVTVVGRDPDVLRRELAPGRRLLVLSSDETTPHVVAAMLRDEGFGASRLTVLGDLGSPAETRLEGRADGTWSRDGRQGDLLDHQVPRLHVLAVEVDGAGRNSWATGLPDEAFEHDGQLTKRDLRAAALARLRPQPGALLWDVGAGAGSVAIEWLRAHRLCRAVAVETQPARAARITRNAAALGTPSLAVVQGRAPDALLDLPAPDAVFVGGGATTAGVLDLCRDRLRPGGRLVVHGVTLETEQLLLAAHADHGGELVRIGVEHVAPLGARFRGWTPARAVTQWAWTKEARP
ncbi:MAG TPA: precorrin-6y C5,15-methyltransferase (decarboxylating) subunit CbiE [Nocardioides sp.]|nr:precorrin-6y C5,15-methyltransferase (decarboxylating) subunit CbiE [Nocardioides sp.]